MSDTNGPRRGTGSTPQQLAELIATTTDEPLVEGDEPISVWMLVKSRDADGDVVWGVRNAGEPFSSEELLGALTGFAESLKRDLASDWET
jgi:hypothetical protein